MNKAEEAIFKLLLPPLKNKILIDAKKYNNDYYILIYKPKLDVNCSDNLKSFIKFTIDKGYHWYAGYNIK
jgi:hypothetical protein